MEIWQILVVAGIIAFIFEVFTAGFIAGSAGIGFFFAAAGNYFGLSPSWQILLFAVGMALTYFLIKPLMNKYGYKEPLRTNRDALLGKTGKVTEEINPEAHTGRVAIDGDNWKAVSKENQTIPRGTTVEVVDIDSIILFVKPLN